MLIKDYIGKEHSQLNMNKLRKDVGCEMIRIWFPDSICTGEYNPTRLNVVLTEENIIDDIYFG